MDLDNYLNIVPSELVEIILSYLAPIDLETLFASSFAMKEPKLEKVNVVLDTNINWGTVYYYAYGVYRKIENYLEYKETGLLDLKNGLKLFHLLYELKKIRILNLYDDQIEEIPKQIEFLIDLEYLNLENNQIKKIPSQIGNLPNLQNLNLRYNQIEEIPNQIGNLSKLKYLNLKDNQIKEIPCQLRNLSNLQELNLMYNQIKEIPRCFGDMMKRRIKLK